MFVSGLGDVRGLTPDGRISINHRIFRAGELGDQLLSLHLPAIIRGEYLVVDIDGNRELSRRLRELNPNLAQQ